MMCEHSHSKTKQMMGLGKVCVWWRKNVSIHIKMIRNCVFDKEWNENSKNEGQPQFISRMKLQRIEGGRRLIPMSEISQTRGRLCGMWKVSFTATAKQNSKMKCFVFQSKPQHTQRETWKERETEHTPSTQHHWERALRKQQILVFHVTWKMMLKSLLSNNSSIPPSQCLLN